MHKQINLSFLLSVTGYQFLVFGFFFPNPNVLADTPGVATCQPACWMQIAGGNNPRAPPVFYQEPHRCCDGLGSVPDNIFRSSFCTVAFRDVWSPLTFMWPNVHPSYHKTQVLPLWGSCISIHCRFSLDLLWWQQWGHVCHSNLSEIQLYSCDGHLACELQPPGFWPCDEWVSHYMMVAYMPRGSSLKSVRHLWTLQVCNIVCVNIGCFFTLLHFSGEEKTRKWWKWEKPYNGGASALFTFTSKWQAVCHAFYFL